MMHMRLEIGNKMMNVSFEPISIFSQGQAPRLINNMKNDDMIVIMKHGKPIASITKVIDGDISKVMVPGIIPL